MVEEDAIWAPKYNPTIRLMMDSFGGSLSVEDFKAKLRNKKSQIISYQNEPKKSKNGSKPQKKAEKPKRKVSKASKAK